MSQKLDQVAMASLSELLCIHREIERGEKGKAKYMRQSRHVYGEVAPNYIVGKIYND